MYYKIINDNIVLDVIQNPRYVTYQERNKIIMFCPRHKAKGILSSDGTTVWNITSWGEIPLPNVVQCELIEILEDEYVILKDLVNKDEPVIIQPEELKKTPKVITLEYVQDKKLTQMKKACADRIYQGIDVQLSDNLIHHFDLTLEDQVNLMTLQTLILNGALEVPYHEKNGLCKMYSKEDMQIIFDAATALQIHETTYFNSLKEYITTLEDINMVNNVYYGMSLPSYYPINTLNI